MKKSEKLALTLGRFENEREACEMTLKNLIQKKEILEKEISATSVMIEKTETERLNAKYVRFSKRFRFQTLIGLIAWPAALKNLIQSKNFSSLISKPVFIIKAASAFVLLQTQACRTKNVPLKIPRPKKF